MSQNFVLCLFELHRPARFHVRMCSTFGSEKNSNWVLTISCGAKNHMKSKFQLKNSICLNEIDNTFLTFLDRDIKLKITPGLSGV